MVLGDICRELDRLCKVEAEDTHNALAIDAVATRHEVDNKVKVGDRADKILDTLDSGKLNIGTEHNRGTPILYFSAKAGDNACKMIITTNNVAVNSKNSKLSMNCVDSHAAVGIK